MAAAGLKRDVNALINSLNRRLRLGPQTPPFRFNGGLTLAPNKRALTGGVAELPLPQTLVLPLTNYAKQPLTPLVEIGESVSRGQVLAEGIVAPTSGIITAIEEHQTIHPASLSINSIVLTSDGHDERLDTAQPINAERTIRQIVAALAEADTGTDASTDTDTNSYINSNTNPDNNSGARKGLGSDTDTGTSTSTSTSTSTITGAGRGNDTEQKKASDANRKLGHGNHARQLLANYALAGLGGAGFPTAEKLLATRYGLKTLIINGAECEPEIACDELIMQSDAAGIAHGIDALVKVTQCTHCVLAIEDSKPDAIKSMRDALNAIDSVVEVMVIPTRYPTGAESPLIQVVTGHSIPHNEKPTEYGVLCINVATAFAFWHALHNQPLDSRVVSLGGSAMPNPCNVRVRLGTPVSFVLANTDNLLDTDNIRYRAGGPLSGFDLTSLSAPVSVRTNCILAEPQRQETPPQPCIRCGDCVDVCPSKLLPQQLHWYAMAEDLKKCAQLNLDACIECGCCDLVCPASIKLTETFRFAKSQQLFARQQQQKAEEAQHRHVERELRLEQRKLAKEAAIKQRKQSLKAKQKPGAEDINAALARARAHRKPKNS